MINDTCFCLIIEVLFCLFIGPTSSGKSVICKKLIENAARFMDILPVEVLFNYGAWQSSYENISSPFPIRFAEGLTKIDDLPKDGQHRLWVIDDLMGEAAKSSEVADLFTKFSHHLNYSVVILCQNLFEKGKYFRTISLNVQYLFLLKTVRDTSIISTLGKQMGDVSFLKQCYSRATNIPYGHLFIDLKPGSDDKYRVRAQIFDDPIIVFIK